MSKSREPILQADGTALVPLTRDHFAVIDAADAPLVAGRLWFYVDGYARTVIDGVQVGLHRFLTKAPKGSKVDHWDGCGLNNRRDNLRVTDHLNNMRNRRPQRGTSSPFKGISRCVTNRGAVRWVAQIRTDGRNLYIGSFDAQEDAARAYDAKALELHGEFARTNASMGLLTDSAA